MANRLSKHQVTFAAVMLAFATWATALQAQTVNVSLSGQNEVPPVTTSATGSGTIVVGTDKIVSGSIKTAGVAGTMAHIHSGKAGENGPVIIPLSKEGDDVWRVPANSKLSDDAFKAFQAGGLYINVHSKAHPGGEIRSQLDAKAAVKDTLGGMPRSGSGGY